MVEAVEAVLEVRTAVTEEQGVQVAEDRAALAQLDLLER
jgi:hypothetical protein